MGGERFFKNKKNNASYTYVRPEGLGKRLLTDNVKAPLEI